MAQVPWIRAETSASGIIARAGWVLPATVVMIILSGFAGNLLLPLNVWVNSLRLALTPLGAGAYLAFGIVYVLATATVLPAAPFSIAAGLLFGVSGLPLALLSATVAAVVAFCLSRWWFSPRVAAFLEGKPLLARVDAAVASEGWRVVCLVRLSPMIPFNVQNYLFGITGVKVAPYALASMLGILPNVALCVYVGSMGRTSLTGVAWRFRGACSWLVRLGSGHRPRRPRGSPDPAARGDAR